MTIFLLTCYKCNPQEEYFASYLHTRICQNCGNKIRPILKSHLVEKLNRINDLELAQKGHDSQ